MTDVSSTHDQSPHNPRDHDHHPHHVPGEQATDSAGLTWGGRDLSPSGFETDSGAPDPVLRALLADPATGESELMAALSSARFLVPVVAEPVETDSTGALVRDTRVDMAAVTLVGPQGERALPVFTGLDSLARWDPQARPVPVTASRMAEAAISESCDVIVLDVADATSRVLRPSMVWALASRRPWQPAATDPFVARSVTAATMAEGELTAYALSDGPGGALVLKLTLVPGLDREAVEALATRVGERLATDGEFRARVDALTFRLR